MMSSPKSLVMETPASLLRFASWWPVLIIIVVGMAVTLAISYLIRRNEGDHIRRQVRTEAEVVARAIEGTLNEHIESVIQVARQWERGRPLMSEWEIDARMRVAQSHGLEGIEWMDSSLVPRWSVYSGVKRSVEPETAFAEPREIALQKARERSGPTLTRIMDLPHGGTGIQVYVPILPEADSARFDGFITAIINVQAMMTGLLELNLWRRYELEVFERGRVIYNRPGARDETKREWAQEADMDLYGVTWFGSVWKVRLWPTSVWFDEMHSPLQGIVLATGAVVTGLLVLLAHLFRLARNSTVRLQSVNADLRNEIAERVRAQTALADFSAMIVHDLRAPLGNTIGIATMMRDGVFGPIDPEQAEWLEKIESSTRGAVDLISDMLDVSKLEAGRIELVKESVDLDRLLRTGLDAYSLEAKKKGISLRGEISPLLPRVVADPRRLDQVVMNLLSNSLKFTESGSITVSASLVEDHQRRLEADNGAGAEGRLDGTFPGGPQRWVEVRVADTGVGIAAEELDEIFQKFKQTGSGTKSHEKGTGLGLVICKMIVEAHGGKIWAESEPRKETTFTFTLPAD